MPLYDFQCENCKHEEEVFINKHEKERECPKCKGKMKIKIGKTTFVFKENK